MTKNYMKIICVLVCAFLFQLSNAQVFKTPVSYLEFIGKENKVITKNMWKYTKAVAHSRSARAIEGKRINLIKSLERTIVKIKKAKAYEGEEDYKNEVITYLELRKNMLKQDYAKIVDMKEVAEQSYDLMEAYILQQELVDKRMQEAQDHFDKKQEAFADRNNITLTKDETALGRKMKISNEVFKHRNEVYLLFFKSNIQESFMMEAVSKEDISAIQQNANALNTFAKEGLDNLKKVILYNDDASIVEATRKAFQFYIDETENAVPKLLEFYLLNEKFNTIKKTIDKKKPSKRTQEEIDEYNAMVKKINKAINDFNKVNQELDQKRSVVINGWNAASANFLAKHIPKE